MIAALATRHVGHAQRHIARFSAWRAAILRLCEDWGRDRPLPLSSYLEQVPTDQRADALQDLIAEHMRLTWSTGRGNLLESYSDVLPVHGDGTTLRSALASLMEDEFLARYQQPDGDMPAPDEYKRRFPSHPEAFPRLDARCLMDDRFIKLDCIGRGGLAEVWRGLDRQTREQVAIKQPLGEFVPALAVAHQLAVEARVLRALAHPGIIGLRAHHVPETGPPALIMNLAQGPTLSERIQVHHANAEHATAHQRWSARIELLTLFTRVCDAVAHAHERGVIHRDLKPGNIIIEQGGPMILDWGMAHCRADEGSNHEGPDASDHNPGLSTAMITGTPAYMAPEQLDGKADARTDVFGLGATLFELLTGRPPRDWAVGALPADWCLLVRNAAIAPPRRIQRDVPNALDAICNRAMATLAVDRHPTVTALVSEVRASMDGATGQPWWHRWIFGRWR